MCRSSHVHCRFMSIAIHVNIVRIIVNCDAHVTCPCDSTRFYSTAASESSLSLSLSPSFCLSETFARTPLNNLHIHTQSHTLVRTKRMRSSGPMKFWGACHDFTHSLSLFSPIFKTTIFSSRSLIFCVNFGEIGCVRRNRLVLGRPTRHFGRSIFFRLTSCFGEYHVPQPLPSTVHSANTGDLNCSLPFSFLFVAKLFTPRLGLSSFLALPIVSSSFPRLFISNYWPVCFALTLSNFQFPHLIFCYNVVLYKSPSFSKTSAPSHCDRLLIN